MYRISRHIIKVEAPFSLIPGLEGGLTTQLSDILTKPYNIQMNTITERII